MNQNETNLQQASRKYWEKVREIKKATTWLQGIGAHRGKPAQDLITGNVIVWNGGYTSKVTKILKETPSTISVELDGKGVRRFKKTRIVAIEGMGVYRNVTQDELNHVRL